jgi:hypothetical protein
MATSTYIPLAGVTLGSAMTEVSITGISQDYSDLVLVVSGAATSTLRVYFQINAYTGSDYDTVRLSGEGSTDSSQTLTNQGQFLMTSEAWMNSDGSLMITEFFDYSATDKHKSLLTRTSTPTRGVEAFAQRLASTAAITSIKVYPSNAAFAAGCTFKLFGIHGEV